MMEEFLLLQDAAKQKDKPPTAVAELDHSLHLLPSNIQHPTRIWRSMTMVLYGFTLSVYLPLSLYFLPATFCVSLQWPRNGCKLQPLLAPAGSDGCGRQGKRLLPKLRRPQIRNPAVAPHHSSCRPKLHRLLLAQHLQRPSQQPSQLQLLPHLQAAPLSPVEAHHSTLP